MYNKLNNVKALYLDGIKAGQVKEAANRYITKGLIQHSTDIADGVNGFVEYFESLLRHYPDREVNIIRHIVDGQYVFIHGSQHFNNAELHTVTADLFATDDNDKITEHWNLTQDNVDDTASGRTMLDGPTKIEDIDKTEANKTLISNFCQDILVDGKHTVTDFISAVQYDQHNPTVEDGLAGLYTHLQEFKAQGITAKYVKVHRIIGQGNFVVALSHAKQNEDDWCFFDIFRIKDDLIVEHWDVQEKLLPKEQ